VVGARPVGPHRAERHAAKRVPGGRIWTESRPGGGTRVSFSLPAKAR
jgi:hypothetical protein